MTVEDLGAGDTLDATDGGRAATMAAAPQAIRRSGEHVPPERPAPAPAPTPAPATTITSSADALLREELTRTQRLATSGMALALVAAALAPFLGGGPGMQVVLLVSLALMVSSNACLYFVARDVRRWTIPRLATIWFVSTLGVLGLLYSFGLMSGALTVAILGIFVVGLGGDTRVAMVVYLTTALGHGLLVVLTGGGVILDRGLMPSVDQSLTRHLAAEALIQGMFLGGFLIARGSRHTTEGAMLELESAVRAIAVREAMLQEARQDFERVAGVGGRGRHTDQVIGSFKLGAVLGRGGMGEVYEAAAVATGAPAAVKLLHLETSADPELLVRFHREVSAAASLRSPHVVTVLEVGDATAPVPYLAMERLRGTDLAGWLRAHPRLPLPEVVELARQVAIGLEAARRAGIVHRDLKPQNLFRLEEPGGAPRWKILDFGVSKVAGHGGTLTADHVVGTPQYMAPEQAAGLEVDHRADVYALTAIVYRCLTGRPPFSGSNAPALLYQVVHATPTRPGELASLSSSIDDVLMRGLAKRPGERPATALELAAALAEAAPRA